MVIKSLSVLTLFILWFCAIKAKAEVHPCDRICQSETSMTCEYNFTIEWYATLSKACYDCPQVEEDCFRKDCIAADGFPRAVTVVNRMLPGPSIKVCEGDQIIVQLSNKLDNGEGTTIHWHGITQRGTPWMDGVPMITQCAVPSGTNFVYNFTAYPAGTHWWHGHSGFHRSDGAFGSFIVKKPALSNLHRDAYDEDKHTILVGDWLHQTTMEKYIQHHHSSGNNKGEGMLINGKGEHVGYQKNGSTVYTPMMTYAVEPLTRYRFRVINNAAVFCPFELSVDGHQLNIIATDGIDVTSHTVTSLVVHGGERFDFVLNANQTPSSYWVRIQGLADCRNSSQRAVLWYNGTTTQRPTSTPDVGNTTKLNPLNEKETERVKFVTSLSTLTPLDVRLAQKPDLVHFVGFDFKLVDNTRYHDSMHYPIKAVPRNHHLYSPQLNNVSFVPSSSPLLSQYDDVDQSLICDTFRDINVPSTTFRACTHIVDIKLGSTVELVVFDEGRTFNAGHPMHLHGHHFAVVAMDKIKSTLSLDEIQEIYANGSIAYNFENTVMKDSVIVPDGGYVVIRFVADNPGIWSFHCHLSFHQEAGMLMAFRVGEEVYKKNIPENFPKCGNWQAIERKSAGMQPKLNNAVLFSCLFILLISSINYMSINI